MRQLDRTEKAKWLTFLLLTGLAGAVWFLAYTTKGKPADFERLPAEVTPQRSLEPIPESGIDGLREAPGEERTSDVTTTKAEEQRAIAIPETETLEILSPNGKRVVIDLKTGAVDLGGMTPDAAAMMFWAAVTRSYPAVKQSITGQ